ncbi:DUF6571 family protein [Streptomyces cavernicola]|uniref:DUF6571 domain-containing protein n=1 Tax=Streptomyces cavernicola TaxID=3043613 RepID=A0ABT6SGR9_9ACTN|nr:DUF6571 family protein [Streptomyces sp. B-S-A6]MDI3407365.1 hypothetical protein [Streptomyces sp. B-S-A6]
MVSFTYLDEADLSKLEAAAKAWSKLPAKYEGLEDQFEARVIKVLEGNWEGEAAATAFRTMKRATREYRAAAEESRRVGKLLTEAHTDFRKYQKQLHDLVERGRKNYLKFSDKGVEDVDSRWDSPTASAAPGFADERKKVLDEATADYKSILAAVTSIDGAVGAALRRDANGADNDSFNGKRTYKDLDEAEAGKASQLMKKKGRLTDSEFMQLNQLLAQNRNDPEFARSFAVRTGAEQTLNKYDQLLNPTSGANLSKAELAQLKQFQKNLGTTIGTATTSDDGDKNPNRGIKKFQDELLSLGHKEFNSNPSEMAKGLTGYHVTSSLMSHGKWDTDFLQEYGEDLIVAEKQGGKYSLQDPAAYWSGDGLRNTGAPQLGALDPMTGFMEALGHNPEASTEFLTSSTDFDGKSVDHLDYLLEDRRWPPPEHGTFTGDPANPSGYDNLGHALESATSGRSYEYEGNEMPKHTETQAGLVKELVNKLGGPDGGELLEGEEAKLRPLNDSLGNITANYMGDFQRALTEQGALPTHGAAADLPRGNTAAFLSSVGQDPEAYKAITAAQQAYTSVAVDQAVNHSDGSSVPPNSRVENAVSPGSMLAGIMSEARAEAVYNSKTAEAEDFNSGTDTAKKWVGRGLTMATESVQVPVVSWVLEDVQTSVQETLKKDYTNEAHHEAREDFTDSQKRAENAAREAVDRATRGGDFTEQTIRDMKDSAAREARTAHSVGAGTERAGRGGGGSAG